MKLLVTTISFLSLVGCDVCRNANSCSQDDHSKSVEYADPQETSSDQPDIVITGEDTLPACDESTKNLTAYKESKNKFYICKDNAWEEFTFNQQDTIDNLSLMWDKAKELNPSNSFLQYTCAILLEIDSNHICNEELNDAQ